MRDAKRTNKVDAANLDYVSPSLKTREAEAGKRLHDMLRAARRLSRDNSLLLAKETWHPGRWKIGKEAGAVGGQLFW